MNEAPFGPGPEFSKDVQGGWLVVWVDDDQTAVRVVFQMK
jgi:hypothetical protein